MVASLLKKKDGGSNGNLFSSSKSNNGSASNLFSKGSKSNSSNNLFSSKNNVPVDKMISYIPYTPRMSDEINLAIGDSIIVMHRYEDGWCLAKNESSGNVGMVPGNFLHNLNNPFLPDTMSVKNTSAPIRKISLALKDKFNSITGFDSVNAPEPVNNIAARQQINYDNTNYIYGNNERDSASSRLMGNTSIAGYTNNDNDQLSVSINHGDYEVQSQRRPSQATLGGRPSNTNVKSQFNDMEFVENIVNKWQAIQRVHRIRSRTPNNLGFVKFGVVGDSGIGKTSLIRTFMEMEEVIKSDSDYMLFESNHYEGSNPSNYGRRLNDVLPGPHELVEIHGCTMDSRKTVINNGKTFLIETADKPMPMNLELIDTPGYSSDLDSLTAMRPLITYQAREFEKTNSVFSHDVPSHFLKGFLSGSTGAHGHIDGIFYCILHRITKVDIELMRRLSKVACIIPVLMKCDTLNKRELINIRINVIRTLCNENINFYGFGLTKEELLAVADFASHLNSKTSLDDQYYGTEYEDGILGNIQTPSDLFGIINFPFVISTKPECTSPVSTGPGADNSNVAFLKQAVLYDHIDDIRRFTADGFLKWREAVTQ